MPAEEKMYIIMNYDYYTVEDYMADKDEPLYFIRSCAILSSGVFKNFDDARNAIERVADQGASMWKDSNAILNWDRGADYVSIILTDDSVSMYKIEEISVK